MFNRTFLRPALTLALACLLGSASAESSDQTTITLSHEASTDVLVINDIDSRLPIGSTGEFETASGKVAIVGRSDDALIIDLDGRSIEVPFAEPGTAADGDRIEVVLEHSQGDTRDCAAGDACTATESRVLTIDRRGSSVNIGDEGNEHRVVVLRGDALPDNLGDLDLGNVDPETLRSLLIERHSGDGTGETQVTVIRKIRRDED